MLVNVLIIFFFVLILYQIFLANIHCIEGFEEDSQVTGITMKIDPLVLEQQNSDKIDLIEKQLDNLSKKTTDIVTDINVNFRELGSKISQLDKRMIDSAGGLTIAASGVSDEMVSIP